MGVKEIQIHKVVEGYHPRKDAKGWEELKEQIQKNGPDPIRVRPENDCFVIIDGNRRLSVLKELGYETVPCIIEEIDEKTAAHQSYVLNAGDYRRNLNPIEVSLHIKEMRERFGYSVQDLVGLGYATDDQTIYNKLSLLTLPQEIQDKIAEGKICPTEGYKLAQVKDPELQSRVLQILVKVKDRSVRKTEKIIKNLIDSVDPNKDEKKASLPAPEGDLPGVFFHDSNEMREFEDGTVPLIIVSPNYGVGMEYEEGVSFDDHKKDLERCVPEWGRKLMSGGYLCINFGDICNFGTNNGTEPEIQLMGEIFQNLLRPLNIRLRDKKIWDKGMTFVSNRQVSFDADAKHTSYRSLHNTEYIFIFKKDGDRKVPYDLDLKSRITEEESIEWVSEIWRIDPVKTQKGHPAQFPEELPRRLIKMFSFEGDIVVDTALGSGTTIKVARELNRKGFGYERDLRYKPVIMKKLGIKEEDLRKPEKKEVSVELTDEERRQTIRTLRNDLLPQIVAETKEKGQHICRLSVPLKRNLSKDDVTVETIPVDDDPTPPETTPSLKVLRADDYKDNGQLLPGKSSGGDQGDIPLPHNEVEISPHLNKVILGDCLEKLKDLPENSVDLIATDPPYGLKFMGKDWDRAVPSADVWKECLRVLKPGAFAFVMCAPRQDCQSRMIINLERAGFKTSFTPLYWTYASGFPKSYNIEKGIEGKLQLGSANWSDWKKLPGKKGANDLGYSKMQHEQGHRDANYQGRERNITVDCRTPQAQKFEGSYASFQPKPAVEVIIVAMKPMDEKTYVAQALKNGKGITWKDDCRIPYADDADKKACDKCCSVNGVYETGLTWGGKKVIGEGKNEHRVTPTKGRFPANLLISDNVIDNGKGFSRFFSLDAWADKNVPFLLVPKASKKEKNIGLEGFKQKTVSDGRKKTIDNPFQRGATPRKNTHPTVKPLKLMAYLITMGSREGDVVLDCFAGSGTTCLAAEMLNRKFIGIELGEEYHEIAVKKLETVAMAMAA